MGLLVHTLIQPGSGTSGGYSPTKDTTGIKFIALVVGAYANSGHATSVLSISDYYGNTYIPRTVYSGGVPWCRVYYCNNPTVGPSHSWLLSGTGIYSSAAIICTDDTVTGFDVENGGASSGTQTSRATGSVTPTTGNSLVIAGFNPCDNGAGTITITGGFTITDQITWASGMYEGAALAYLYTTSTAALNPTWTIPTASTQGLGTAIAVFKLASSGVTGTADGSAPAPTGDASGTLNETGTADGAAPAPTGDASGTLDEAGTADASAPGPTADASGTSAAPGVSGDVDADAPAPTGDASGTLDETGTVDADAPAPTGDGSGTLDESGTVDASAPAPTGDASGTLDETGTVDAAAPAPTGDASGTLDETGSADADAPAPTGDASGAFSPPGVSGAADADAPSPTADASGTSQPPDIEGDADATAPAPTADAQGTLDETGSVDASAPAPGGDASGTLDGAGTVNAATPAPGADASGTLDETGTADADAPAPTADVQGVLPGVLPPPIEPRFTVALKPRSFDALLATRGFEITLNLGGPMQRIGPKYPYERVPVRLDFKRLLGAGETVTGVDAVEMSVGEGSDSAPGNMLDTEGTVIDDTTVLVWVKGGLDQVDYELAAKVTTSAEAKREGKVRLFITETQI